jgi:hypothetical protein
MIFDQLNDAQLTYRWIFVIFVIILNFIAYWNDYLRYSNAKAFGVIKNKTFSLITGIGTFLLDMLALFILINTSYNLKHSIISIIPLIGIGLTFIIWVNVKNSDNVNDLTNKLKEEGPQFMLERANRLRLYTIIFFIDLIIWFQDLIYSKTGISSNYLLFGGTTIGLIVTLISLLGPIADIIALRTQTLFQIKKDLSNDEYDHLSESWQESNYNTYWDTMFRDTSIGLIVPIVFIIMLGIVAYYLYNNEHTTLRSNATYM